MKYQNFAIIFVIIVLPISIVLSMYIQNQTDTLTLQTRYQSKLNDATYDAISAYQMNSLNTQRVTGESVKSYVLASVNTFFTTLATNLGMSSASKSRLQTYVPAILFTTYDGYYIYSPTKTAIVAEDPDTGIGLTNKKKEITYVKSGADIDEYKKITSDQVENIANGTLGNDFTINSDEAKLEYNYMLKPFIYYSAQYKKGDNYDFIASYSLDNYVTVYGKKRDGRNTDDIINNAYVTEEFTKSGYLIDPNKIKLSGDILIKTVTRNGDISSVEPSVDGTATYEAVIKANQSPNSASHNTVKYNILDVTSDDAYNYINYFEYGDINEIGYNGYYPCRKNRDGTTIRYQTGDDIIESTLDIEELKNNGREDDVNNYLTIGGTFERNYSRISRHTNRRQRSKRILHKSIFLFKMGTKQSI